MDYPPTSFFHFDFWCVFEISSRFIIFFSIKQCRILSFRTHYPVHISVDMFPPPLRSDLLSKCFSNFSEQCIRVPWEKLQHPFELTLFISTAVIYCPLCCWQKWSPGSSGSKQRARWIIHSWPLTLARTNLSSAPGNPYPTLLLFSFSFLCPLSLLSVLLLSFILVFFLQRLLVRCMSNDQFLHRCLQKKNGFGDCFQVHCLCRAQPSVCVFAYMCTCIAYVVRT